ncbi:MAG: hypothetical protein EP348_00235 [Alphaproteobacteria bacterium]|nr:MAG: hypothetical protein EP348_00235 [Alphaproteobacteria bacterium]
MFLSIGRVAGALSIFARNIVIARLITVEDFGIAATFSITMALIEMSSALGVERLIVQATDGNNPRLQATIQSFNVIRGMLIALILYAIAGPVANLFDLPELTWAYQWLAIVPLVNGFLHMDSARMQRDMVFGPIIWTEEGPKVITLLLTIPFAHFFPDYRSVLFLVFTQAISGVVISHVVVRRRYRWAWDRAIFRRIFKFGWPLILNGLLLFGVFQADRTLVGIAYGMEDLGWFSAAFTLTLFPSMVLANICRTYFTPMLSKVQNNQQLLQNGAIATIKACILLGLLLCTGLALAGPPLLLLLFGDKYAEGAEIIGWLALMQGLRTVKAGPVIVAIACGRTKLPLYANIIRSLALLIALTAIWQGWGILGVVSGGIIGEALAVFTILFLLRRTLSINLSTLYGTLLFFALATALALILVMKFVTGHNPLPEIAGAAAFCFCALGLFILFSRDLVRWLARPE